MSSSVHLHTDENVLDDFDDEDRFLEQNSNQFCYQAMSTNNSEMTPYKLQSSSNNLQHDFGGSRALKKS